MKKAMIGMSGGVDSSVAAFLTRQAGFQCIGATMRLFSNDALGEDQQSTCCSLDDVEDARSVCRRMGIPHYAFNFQDDFRSCVMEKFVRCYEAGQTPSPCIDCNRYLKFGTMLRRGAVTKPWSRAISRTWGLVSSPRGKRVWASICWVRGYRK